jgi:hypothetical protein
MGHENGNARNGAAGPSAAPSAYPARSAGPEQSRGAEQARERPASSAVISALARRVHPSTASRLMRLRPSAATARAAGAGPGLSLYRPGSEETGTGKGDIYAASPAGQIRRAVSQGQEALASASGAALRRSDPSGTGIRRRRCGHGFSHLGPDTTENGHTIVSVLGDLGKAAISASSPPGAPPSVRAFASAVRRSSGVAQQKIPVLSRPLSFQAQFPQVLIVARRWRVSVTHSRPAPES